MYKLLTIYACYAILVLNFDVSLANYEFKHFGHCADGWDKNQIYGKHTKLECYLECAKRPRIGYFAHSEIGYINKRNGSFVDCSCYFSANGCPDDIYYDDFDAYRIIKK